MTGMEESGEPTPGVHESINGDSKQDVTSLAKSAIIKQDVMLSGTTVQSPVITSPPVSIPTPGIAMTPGTFPDHFFLPMSLPHHTEGAYTQTSSKATSQTPLLGQPPVASQFILAGQMAAQNAAAAAAAVPLQQLLIAVSTANGSQQLLTVPVNLGGGAQSLQLLPSGQLITANLASLPGLTSLSGLSGLVALNQPVTTSVVTTSSGNIKSEQSQLPSSPVTPQILTSGQIVAMGAQLLSPSAVGVSQSQAPPNTTVHHIPKSMESTNRQLPISSHSLDSSTTSLTNNTKPRPVVEPTFTYPSITVPPAHSVTVTAPPNTQSTTPLPSIQTLTQHAPSVLSQVSQSTANGLPANINQLLPNTVSNSSEKTTVDGINLDEIKEFARMFKIRRLSLGLTQTQVGQALSATEGPAYSQSAICRFEKLDITPKSAQKIKPVLEKWMGEAEERYKNGLSNLTDFIGSEPSKKRKRRTSFTPHAVDVLNEFFERNTHPSGAEMTEMSDKLNYDREVIRVWFCNKRQALKNTIKRLKASENFSHEAYSREIGDVYPVSSSESAMEKSSSDESQGYVINARDSLPITTMETPTSKTQGATMVTS